MLDLARIRAITLDLDDTLWPMWPTMLRAEETLQAWLDENAPATGELYSLPGIPREIRRAVNAARPDLAHDLTALRRESIRQALLQAGDNPALAEPAFEAFYEARHQVELYADALPALEFLSRRYPVVALSNGNADVQRVGIGQYFCAAFSARTLGVAKPDVRIFQVAARAAGVPPEQVLHVGDDAQLDGGALQAGMQLAWVNRLGHPWPADLPGEPHAAVPDLRSLCELLAAQEGENGS